MCQVNDFHFGSTVRKVVALNEFIYRNIANVFPSTILSFQRVPFAFRIKVYVWMMVSERHFGRHKLFKYALSSTKNPHIVCSPGEYTINFINL